MNLHHPRESQGRGGGNSTSRPVTWPLPPSPLSISGRNGWRESFDVAGVHEDDYLFPSITFQDPSLIRFVIERIAESHTLGVGARGKQGWGEEYGEGGRAEIRKCLLQMIRSPFTLFSNCFNMSLLFPFPIPLAPRPLLSSLSASLSV